MLRVGNVFAARNIKIREKNEFEVAWEKSKNLRKVWKKFRKVWTKDIFSKKSFICIKDKC